MGLGRAFLREGFDGVGRGSVGDHRLPDDRLDEGIERGAEFLMQCQQADGHWVFELEADCTIPAEFILLQHFLGEPRPALERAMGHYIRSKQNEEGGWPLFHGGDTNLSSSVKAYLALKLAGDREDAPHMRRAREAILAHGGAERSNVFTRIYLALFGEVPWQAVPVMPVEIMNLPRWFPFHLDKISYWSRVCLVPLLVLMALKPRARNPHAVRIRELFSRPPEEIDDWLVKPNDAVWASLFINLDRLLRPLERRLPTSGRRRAIERAIAFVLERLNGEDGLGAIYPAMASTVMMFDALGWPADDPRVTTARAAIDKLIVRKADHAYVQPCFSPVWDTALAAHALMEVGDGPSVNAAERGLRWLADRQVLDFAGDWAVQRPQVAPGGWAFQYANPHYPDVDDTAVVAMAMHRHDPAQFELAVARATSWVLGMQSRNGGWGAFDADNTHFYLNSIPFADHGALLDPPTADVTARCLGMLAQLRRPEHRPAIAAAIDYLRREQEPDGAWFGRWGTNYVYGTWSVLVALRAAGLPTDAPEIRRAVAFLESRQRPDGGWGEDGRSYWPDGGRGTGSTSTASQTAWAVLGLMAAGEARGQAVRRGILHLLETQRPSGGWDEPEFTAVGFPRVFYLRYHGYPVFFPLWAIARYRQLTRGNAPDHGFGL